MKQTALAIILTLYITTFVSAKIPEQEGAKVLPRVTVDQVLEKYVDALGGRAAFDKVLSRISKGTLTVPETLLCAEVEIYQKMPNKYAIVWTSSCLPNVPILTRGFNGELRWFDFLVEAGPTIVNVIEEHKSGGPLAAQIEQDYLEYWFGSDLRLKTIFPQLVLSGTKQIGGQQAYVLEVSRFERKWYFDSTTGLLLAKIYKDPWLSGTLEVDYLDYRIVDGVKVPFIQRIFDGDRLVQIIKLTEIKHNLPIDDIKFKPPAKHDAWELKMEPFIKPQ